VLKQHNIFRIYLVTVIRVKQLCRLEGVPPLVQGLVRCNTTFFCEHPRIRLIYLEHLVWKRLDNLEKNETGWCIHGGGGILFFRVDLGGGLYFFPSRFRGGYNFFRVDLGGVILFPRWRLAMTRIVLFLTVLFDANFSFKIV